MDREMRKQWVRDLAQRSRNEVGWPQNHVFDKLAALLAPSEVTWLGVQITADTRKVISGQLQVFTDELFAIVDMQEIRNGGIDAGAGYPGTTQIQLLSRKSLVGIELPETGAINQGEVWAYKGTAVWAPRAEIHLTYACMRGPIVLRSREERGEGFDDLVPALVRDLCAAAD